MWVLRRDGDIAGALHEALYSRSAGGAGISVELAEHAAQAEETEGICPTWAGWVAPN